MNRRQALIAAGAAAVFSPLAGCSGPRGIQQASTGFLPLRSVNLGNALEAPNEGDWGYRIAPQHLQAIASAGFDGVRLPVRWDAHCAAEAPFTIEPAFFDRVEAVVLQALAAGLKVQLDAHHYEGLIARPEMQRARFVAIWRQISERFADAPQDDLIFEPLNEPFGIAWNGPLLTGVQADAIATVRDVSPARAIVIGPGGWQSIDALSQWRPPEAENIAVSAHYYEPYAFTHQGAQWMGAQAPNYPRNWGKNEDLARVREHIGIAAAWARAHGLPLQIGEFGVNARVNIQQRAVWTRAVRVACDLEGAAWCVWDFAGAFPIYDREAGRFLPEMLDALFGAEDQ